MKFFEDFFFRNFFCLFFQFRSNAMGAIINKVFGFDFRHLTSTFWISTLQVAKLHPIEVGLKQGFILVSNGKKEKIHSYSNSTDDYIHKIQKNDVNLREESVALNGGRFSLLMYPAKLRGCVFRFFGSKSIGYWKVWWVAFTQFAVQQRNNSMTRNSTFFQGSELG